MYTKKETTQRFACNASAKCHNAFTDGKAYWLHGNKIAEKLDFHRLRISWCGYYTVTTASHINEILKAFEINQRVSYAKARDNAVTEQVFALPETLRWDRIDNDTNGNPRFVCHYLSLLTHEEILASRDVTGDKYSIALARAKKIGGKKFHNKQYGGGIVFQSYCLDNETRLIAELTGRNYIIR